MNTSRPYNRVRLWTGVIIGIGLGIILGHLMESYPLGAISGIIVGLALGLTLGKNWLATEMS